MRIQRSRLEVPTKKLIESTAKVVLRERGLTVDDRADIPQLVRDAQQTLRLHPNSATPGPDGSEAVTLSNL